MIYQKLFLQRVDVDKSLHKKELLKAVLSFIFAGLPEDGHSLEGLRSSY